MAGKYFPAVLLVAFVLLIAFFFYRWTLPPLSRTTRIVLSVLRGLALALLILLLFEPLLRIIHRDQQSPVVAVLIDNSESMSLTDGSGNRAAGVKAFLRKESAGRGIPGARVEFYLFSSKLSFPSGSPPDSMVMNGQTTDISEALGEIKNRLGQENIQSVVLISDGNYTTGKNPEYLAEETGLPVYTVGVGDTSDQKDVLIQNVNTNAVAYADERVPMDVTVRSSGYRNENVEVSVREGSSILDHKTVTLQPGTQSYLTHLSVVPKEDGVQKYTVEVTKLPGELTEKNNYRSLYIKVLKNRLRVYLIAGAPSPDVAAMAQMLREDEHNTVREFVQKSSSEFYQGNLSDAVLDSADCLVLVGFPTAMTPPPTVQQIAQMIERKKTPLFFCSGKFVDGSKLSLLNNYLPFQQVGPSTTSEITVTPAIPEKAKTNPLIILDGKAEALDWEKLPPIYKTQANFRTKPESEILASVSIQNIVFPEPLIAIRTIAHQRSLGITGYGVWRWRLMAQGDVKTENLFPAFVTNAIRWLTTNEDEKRVRIVPVKESFTTGEPAQFTAQVYNELLRPVDDAELVLELTRGNEKTPLVMTSVGNGLYEGSATGLAEGDYTFVGKAAVNGAPVGEDKGRFTVGQLNVEFLETKQNKPLLEQMAYRTGGKYYPLSEGDSVIGDIRQNVHLTTKDLVHSAEIELWNWRYLAAFIVALFAVEWFLRKRMGML